jgi:hypothetical protein
MLFSKDMTEIIAEHLITNKHVNYLMMPLKDQIKSSQLKTFRHL